MLVGPVPARMGAGATAGLDPEETSRRITDLVFDGIRPAEPRPRGNSKIRQGHRMPWPSFSVDAKPGRNSPQRLHHAPSRHHRLPAGDWRPGGRLHGVTAGQPPCLITGLAQGVVNW